MDNARILVSTFGSAGDLFPLMPSILALQTQGHQVRCATSRSVGLYLRSCGIPSVALGDGSEMSVIDDPHIFSTRFDGWSSWRRTLVKYVAPTLDADVHQIERLFQDWRPDVVVTSGFAVAARIAAHRNRVPIVNCSIYPQHEEMSSLASLRFARPCVRIVRDLVGPLDSIRHLVWGAPSDFLLHDPLLLDPEGAAQAAVGFPYWDRVPGSNSDVAAVDRWLERSGPHLLVTLGSFVGRARRAVWEDAASVVAELGISAVFVGARAPWAEAVFSARSDVLCVGFLPLSDLMGRFDAVVHHGGIGTTFAALRGARPAVVVPQAFDQSFNARMVERVGVGLDASSRPLISAVESALQDPGLRERSRDIAGRLRPPIEATTALCEAVVAEANNPT